MIRASGKSQIALKNAATVTQSRSYTSIQRVDGRRIIAVTANVVPGQANENQIPIDLKSEFLPYLAINYTGLQYGLQG